MTAATGGKAYFAENWKDEQKRLRLHSRRLGPSLFAELLPASQSQSRLAHHHRETVNGQNKKYHVRTRDGYRLRNSRYSSETVSATQPQAGPARP